MSTRPVTVAVLLAATSLGACSDSGDGTASGSSTTIQTPSTPTTSTPVTTVTVTVAPTTSVTSTPTLPAPTLSKPFKPNTTMSVPPPAKERLVIPDEPQAYGQAFVTAWVDRDRVRAARLGTATAVTAAFGSTVRTAPAFQACEGAAGSSYCTWEGTEYTMTLRILNEKSSQRQDQAVTEVKFAH